MIITANYPIGVCPCGKDIISGEGVRTDPDGVRWHPECRTKNLQADGVAVEPKRRGRPPKNPTPTEP
jgi:hypothetical protein